MYNNLDSGELNGRDCEWSQSNINVLLCAFVMFPKTCSGLVGCAKDRRENPIYYAQADFLGHWQE